MRASALAAGVPPERWLAINAGDGAKGKRWYAWTRTRLAQDGAPAGWGRWLLVRRSLATGELAFYRCAAPAAPSLATLARVAGCRWRIEECLQATKGLCGLDEHQVRCWRSWHRLAIGPGFSSPWPSSPSPTAGSVPARLPTTSAFPGDAGLGGPCPRREPAHDHPTPPLMTFVAALARHVEAVAPACDAAGVA